MTPEINKLIENDIKGAEEKHLENKAKEAIKKLQEKGKLSNEELKNIYTTNYKKLFSGEIKNVDILMKKTSELDQLTNKLISTYLKKNHEKTKEWDSWTGKIAKKTAYTIFNIDQDLTKNSKIGNIGKGIIDELLSIPEMFEQLVKHPIDTFKGLYEALVQNFSQTMKEITKQYMNIFSGLWTPQDQYKTGRSAALIILTFLPGWATKWLGKLASAAKNLVSRGMGAVKNIAKTTLTSGVKAGVRETVAIWKNAGKKAIEVTKNTYKATIEGTKNAYKGVKETLKNPFKTKSALEHNKALSQKVTDLNEQLDKLKKVTPPDKKAINTINKELKAAKKELSQHNTKIGLDNNKLKQQQKGLKWIEKSKAKLDTDKAALKAEQLKKTPDPKVIKQLESRIKRVEKSIAQRTERWNNLNTNLRTRSIYLNKAKAIPSLIKKWFSINTLKKIFTSPSRLPFVKNLRKFRQLKQELRRLTQQSESITAKLNKSWKNGKTALENAKAYPQLKQSKNILDLAKKKTEILKTIDQTTWWAFKELRNGIARMALGLGLIGSTTQEATKGLFEEQTLLELEQYLWEANDEYNTDTEEKDGVESGKTDIVLEEGDLIRLNSFTDEELKTVKITITGKASKTWSHEVNIRIAKARAESMKKQIMEKYPTLNANNITIETAVQPQDSTDELGKRQSVDLNIKSKNNTYIAGYDPQTQASS